MITAAMGNLRRMTRSRSESGAELPTDWWTASDCAAYLGISRSTWTAYVSREQAPEPDRRIGRTAVWRPATVTKWAEGRPRAGRRGDEPATSGGA